MAIEKTYLEELKVKLTEPLHRHIVEIYIKNDPASTVLSELVKKIKEDFDEDKKY